MRSDQRYPVREAIRREQGELARSEAREYERRDEEDEPPRRESRRYDHRAEGEEPPRRESRDYERREYREEPPAHAPRERQPYSVREPAPEYSHRERRPAYADHANESEYRGREEGRGYAYREPPARRPMREERRPLEERRLRGGEWSEDREEDAADQPSAPAWFAVTRATAFFLGSLTLLNLLGEMRFSHFSATGWWIDLAFLPRPAARGVLALSAVLFLAFAIFPRANSLVRRLGALSTLGLLAATGWAAYRFYRQDHAGQNFHDLPLPFALHLASLLTVALAGQLFGSWERTSFFKDFFVGMVTLGVCAASFPLAQFFCVGQLDDRVPGEAPADAVVVCAGSGEEKKGADEKAAPAPAPNPFTTACQLYRDGRVKKILFVARPDQTATSAQVLQTLRRAAQAEGVSEADLLSPPAPADSRTVLADSAKLLDEQKLSRVLVVAPFYEVPRIKLSLERAGLEVHCAPIREDVRSPKMRPLLMREAAALWMCHLQPLLM
jgi:uncharacterized SAM-binding protein YcdF (DUF218 family)